MYSVVFIGILVIFGLSGCAVGQKFSYINSTVNVGTMSAVRTASLTVLGQREYVKNGNKSESFVGLSRGGFGNPFDVETQSGTPMASEMATSIATGLKAKGLKVQTITVKPTEGPEGSRTGTRANRVRPSSPCSY